MVNYRKNLRMGFELRKKEKYIKIEKFIKKRGIGKGKSRRLNAIAIKYQELKVLDREVAEYM